MAYQIAQHIPSGETYAVRFDDDGTVLMSHALHHSETDFDFDDYEYEYHDEMSAWYHAQQWRILRTS